MLTVAVVAVLLSPVEKAASEALCVAVQLPLSHTPTHALFSPILLLQLALEPHMFKCWGPLIHRFVFNKLENFLEIYDNLKKSSQKNCID